MTPYRRLRTALSAASVAALLGALPAVALDLEDMTEAERQAFRAEVRAYLLDNPEVLMEAIGVLEAREQAAQAEAESAQLAAVGPQLYDDGFSWVGGNPDGDITLVEFMDYRCGYCRRAFQEVEGLVAADGNIRFILKELPILGEQSTWASQFAIAVKQLHGDEDYKAAHDALMVIDSDITLEALARLAEELGLEADAVLARMDSAEVAAEIEATGALARALGINGTPTFVLGEQLVRGYVPAEAMSDVIARMRADG